MPGRYLSSASTWDPAQRQLLSNPAAGLTALRSQSPLATRANAKVAAGQKLVLVGSGASAADVEIELSGLAMLGFGASAAAVAENASFSIGVLGGSKKDHQGRTGLVFEVQIVTGGGGGPDGGRRVVVTGTCSAPARGKTTPRHCVACPAGASFALPAAQDSLSFRVLVNRTAVEFLRATAGLHARARWQACQRRSTRGCTSRTARTHRRSRLAAPRSGV
eukprot:SAG22_NODE_2764_length_2229_cov_3.613146_2_plen_220_part_00